MASPNAEVDDQELMARLAKGEVSLLGELYLRYGKSVQRRLTCFVPAISLDETEDLCQEVFISAYRAAPRYKESGKLTSWLLAIAAKKARAFKRKSFLRRHLLGRYKDQRKVDTIAPEASVESQIGLRQQFEQAFFSLAPSYREVLLMSAVEEMSGEEIAESLGIRVGAVWTKLHRARRAMRAAMDADSVKGPKETE